MHVLSGCEISLAANHLICQSIPFSGLTSAHLHSIFVIRPLDTVRYLTYLYGT